MKIVQPAVSRHDVLERHWNGRLRRVGKIHLAVDSVAMQFGAEGVTHLRGRAAERDPVAAARLVRYSEAFGTQPCLDLVEVALAEPKTIGILLRREPLVVIRRRRVLLLGEQSLESGPLAGRLLQQQGYAPCGERGIESASVELRACLGMDRAAQDDPLCPIDAGGDAVLLGLETGDGQYE